MKKIYAIAIFFLISSSAIAQNYCFDTIPFAPYPVGPGLPVWTTGSGPTDDVVSDSLDIGFTFCFLGNNYDHFFIGSNGWVGFSDFQATTFTSAPIPNQTLNVPKNCIMGPWQDWWATLNGVGSIRYHTIGVAPLRKLVVSFTQVPLFSCTGNLGTFQIVLHESSNIIENIITNKPACLIWAGGTAVQGIHDLTGTFAITVPGRNSTQWTAQNETTIYYPSGSCPTIDQFISFNPQDSIIGGGGSTGIYPEYEIGCESDSLMIYFERSIFCSSITSNGSELRMINSLNQSLPILSQTPFCNAEGVTDSMLVRFASPMYQNGTYYLITKIGSDGDTYEAKCRKVKPNDSIKITISNCYEYNTPLDLINVTVKDNEDVEVTWKTPANFDTSYFEGYKVFRNDFIYGGTYNLFATINSWEDTVYVDENPSVSVSSTAHDYHVVLKIRRNPDTAPSDSIASIFLQNPDGLLNGDTPVLATLSWNSYWGWPNPSYEVYIRNEDSTASNWTLVGTTTDTTYSFLADETEGKFCLKVSTKDTISALESESNWLCFSIIDPVVIIDTPTVVIPNTITPNGDGINDAFVITNLEFYPGTEFSVINRWGTPVYKSSNYQNDWSPAGNIAAGVYFYIVSLPTGEIRQGTLTILK